MFHHDQARLQTSENMQNRLVLTCPLVLVHPERKFIVPTESFSFRDLALRPHRIPGPTL